jgi:putative membrane protein insertion efficiency factor
MRANPLWWLAIGFVTAWRKLVSPAYGQVCRFHPSCSAYSLDALRRFGFIRGSYLTIRRLLRCHPWNRGGYDPVPRVMTWRRHHDGQEPGSDAEADSDPDVNVDPEANVAAGARSTTSR